MSRCVCNRGRCFVCNRLIWLKANGTLRAHGEDWPAEWCVGSWLPPRADLATHVHYRTRSR